MEQTKCFACLNACFSKRDDNGTVITEKTDTLNHQSEATFLLRSFLEFSDEMCHKFLQDYGSPSKRIYCCEVCQVLVGKAKKVFDEMKLLKNKFTELQTRFKSTIALSMDSHSKLCKDDQFGTSANGELRTYVCEALGLSETESNIVKYEYSSEEQIDDDDNGSVMSYSQEVSEDSPVTDKRNDLDKELGLGESQPGDLPENTNEFVCGVCKKQFSTDLEQKNHECDSAKLKEYLGSLMLTKTLKNYTCYICNKSFKHSLHLEKHIESHSNPRKDVNARFVCHICDRPFDRAVSLENHVKSHSQSNQIVRHCNFCGKVFKTVKDRDEHIRSHTGEKPYKCDTCGKRFTRPKHLKSHRLTLHKTK